MHRNSSCRLFLALTLLSLAVLASAAGAWAQSSVVVVDTKTKLQVTSTGDNLGQGTAGASYTNQRVFTYTNEGSVNLTIQDCSITAPWTITELPGEGVVDTVLPSLPYGFTVDLTAVAPGTYSANLQCLGSAGFGFPVSWLLLNPQATIAVAAGSTAIASGGSFSFPATLAGTTASETFVVTNLGQTALTVSNLAVTGTGFSLGSSQSLQSIAAGASATFAVNFSPTSGSPYTGGVTLTSNDSVGNGKFKINLNGTGTAAMPTIQVTNSGGTVINPGSTVSYGQPTAGTPVTQTFRIINSGNVALAITNPTSMVSGTGYSLSQSPPASIAANGGTGSFSVSFVASAGATYNGQVSIQSNASPSPYTFALTATIVGTGTSSDIVVYAPNGAQIANGGTYNVAPQPVGGPIQVQTFHIGNQSSTSTVEISGVAVTGAPSFTVGSTETGPEQPDSLFVEEVQFQAAATGPLNGTLSFNAAGTPWTINLASQGLPDQAGLAVSVTATGTSVGAGQNVAFLYTTTAGTPISESFTLSNFGSAALTIDSFTVTSPAGCFILLDPPASPVAANGGTTTARIRLFSTTPVSCTGTVTITSNAPGSPFTFNLAGTISAVPYSLSIVSGDGISIQPGGSYSTFPATTSGVSVSRTFTITNSSASAITISNASSILTTSGGFYLLVAPPSSIPGSGGTGIFRIRLLAGSPGTYTGTVTLDGDPAGPYTFSISGTVN